MNYYGSFIIVIFLICAYGNYRCNHPEYKDILETELGIFNLDGWSLSHFTFFTYIGYYFPDTMKTSIGLGIAWELFEHYYGVNRPGWLGGYGDCNNLQSDRNKDGNWWYGKYSDIILNYLGFVSGIYLKTNKLSFNIN